MGWAKVRILPLALLVGLVLATLSGGASGAQTPQEMSFVCAKKDGHMRYVTSPGQCRKNETAVTIKPGPNYVCVRPNGAARLVSGPSACSPPPKSKLLVVLPPASGTVYFCATTKNGSLRYVTDPAQCTAKEFPVFVTPNDTAPSVTTTSPATGADHVATDTNVVVNFSESVSATASSFTLECPTGTPQPFIVSGSPGSSITLDPTADLPEGTTCAVKVIANQISDTDSVDPPDHMAADYNFSFTTDSAPAVTSTTPADGATAVAPSANVTVSFSEPVNAGGSSFTVECPTGTPQSFGVSGSGTSTITLDPSPDLPAATVCTVTVLASGISDVDTGDPPDHLAANYVFSFTTADAAPFVASTSPADGADHVATDTNVVVNFSESVSATASSFTLECPTGSPESFTVSGSPGSSITLDPTSALPEGTTCTVTVIANQISDTDSVDPPDRMAANYVFTFTTDAAPVVTTSTPADGATDVDPSGNITVNFSEPVNVSTSSFTISCDSNLQTFSVAGVGTSAITLDPSSDLPSTATCTVTAIASNISDVDSGDPPDHPALDTVFSFTTQDAAPSVMSTSPADGATDLVKNTNIVVNFSESVSATSNAFSLECPTGTPEAFSQSSSPATTITLTPDANLPAGTTCTVTVHKDEISDTDLIDPPDHMAANYTFSFTVVANQAPTDINLSSSSVAENQPSGTTVGTLSTVDPDAGDTFTYSLVSGTGDTGNASFQISGDQLQTNAVFDFETKSSYSIRVRSTDSGSLFTEKVFTISITNVNEPPTDITLDDENIDENKSSGSLTGNLAQSGDPDSGETYTFSLQGSGCGGGPFADNSSFQISGNQLQSAVSFNFEAKASYTICVRVSDPGSPNLSFDKQFTITINDVNDPPVAVADSYTGAIGNTLAVVQTTGSGPNVVLTGNVLTANDTDEDTGLFAHALSAVAETNASTGGGSATISTDGSFTFLPGVGDKNQNDTFTYHVTDGTATSAGTVTVHIEDFLVWYVDNASVASTHDGRSPSPFLNLSSLNGAGGSGDSDGAGDIIFLYQGSGSYGGGIPLEANQKLIGEKAGLTVNGNNLVAAGATAPVITNASGTGVGLANGVDVEGLNVSGTSGSGIAGNAVMTATVGTTTAVNVSSAGGDGVRLDGAAGGNISIAAPITGSAGHSVFVGNRSSGTVAFSGAISDSGTGISLGSNTGATINFTGGITASTGASAAFSAAGGGTVNVTGSNNTLATTTGTALNVDSTTIGASGLNFHSIASTGAVNGIRLKATGSTGSVTVNGSGSTTQGGDFSGGTIQNTTGAGILLTTTRGPSFNNMRIMNTPNAPGVDGTGVTNFSFTNGTITGNGGTSHGAFDSNLAFNDNGATIDNLDGAVTITNNVLSNAYQSGFDVLNNSGTISDLNVSNNAITSLTASADSAGSGIRINALGSASTAATITKGELNGNNIQNFPNGDGIVVQGGNTTGAGAPGGNFGTNGTTGLLQIDNNLIRGQNLGNPLGTNCILVTMPGNGTGFVDVSSNGTVANPIAFSKGNCLSINSTGNYNLTATANNNVVKPQSQNSGAFGIAGGTDKQTLADLSVADSAVLNLTANGNTVSSTTGVGIYFLANSQGTLNAKIQNNTVAAPTDVGVARPAIRVDSGSSTGTAVDTTVCANVSNNTATGSSASGFQFDGVAFRKQGTTASPNEFGIVGLPGAPTADLAMQTYLRAQNPAETIGDAASGALINTHGANLVWESCTLGF